MEYIYDTRVIARSIKCRPPTTLLILLGVDESQPPNRRLKAKLQTPSNLKRHSAKRRPYTRVTRVTKPHQGCFDFVSRNARSSTYIGLSKGDFVFITIGNNSSTHSLKDSTFSPRFCVVYVFICNSMFCQALLIQLLSALRLEKSRTCFSF